MGFRIMSPDSEGVLDRSEYRMLLGEADKLYCKNKVLKGRFLPHVLLLRLDLPLLKLQSSQQRTLSMSVLIATGITAAYGFSVLLTILQNADYCSAA